MNLLASTLLLSSHCLLTKSATISDSVIDPNDQSIRVFGTDDCIFKRFSSYKEGNYIWLGTCDVDNKNTKTAGQYKWSHHAETGLLKSVGAEMEGLDYCWQLNNKNSKAQRVRIFECDASNELQQFDLTNGRIQSRANGNLCVGFETFKVKGFVMFSTCYANYFGVVEQEAMTTEMSLTTEEEMMDDEDMITDNIVPESEKPESGMPESEEPVSEKPEHPINDDEEDDIDDDYHNNGEDNLDEESPIQDDEFDASDTPDFVKPNNSTDIMCTAMECNDDIIDEYENDDEYENNGEDNLDEESPMQDDEFGDSDKPDFVKPNNTTDFMCTALECNDDHENKPHDEGQSGDYENVTTPESPTPKPETEPIFDYTEPAMPSKPTEPEFVEPESPEPTTMEPNTVKPIEPETVKPETMDQETMEPETMAPETMAPETMKPETLAPETMAPKTMESETLAPGTIKPETLQQETMVPETIAPETMKPETMEPETTPLTPMNCESAKVFDLSFSVGTNFNFTVTVKSGNGATCVGYWISSNQVIFSASCHLKGTYYRILDHTSQKVATAHKKYRISNADADLSILHVCDYTFGGVTMVEDMIVDGSMMHESMMASLSHSAWLCWMEHLTTYGDWIEFQLGSSTC